MKKTGRDKVHFSFAITALLCVVVVIGMLFLNYIQRFGQTMQEENRARLSEVSGYISGYMEKMLAEQQKGLGILASYVSYISDEGEQVEYLGRMAQELGFEYVGIVGADGKLKSTAFVTPKDVSGEEYYIKASEGIPFISDITREIFYDRSVGGVVIAVPVPGTRKQVLTAMLSTTKLGEGIQVDSFNKEGYSYVINGSGDLVIHTRSMEYNNLFQSMQNMRFASGYSLGALKEDIVNQKEGMAVYYDFEIEKYLYYKPMEINGWTVVSTVPAGVITKKTAVLSKDLVKLCAISVAVLLVLLTTVYIMSLRMETRKKETQAKSAFLANMSHDMRTPMNAIMGMTAIAETHAEEPDTVRDCLKKISLSSRHLLGLINDILDMAKIESGEISLADQEVSLAEVFESSVNIVYPQIRMKHQEFSIRLHQVRHENLYGDELRLGQIFINILSNAVKFTPEQGEIVVDVEELPQKDQENAWFRFVFKDNGIGMKPDFLKNIFHSFTREQDSKVDKIEGSGLGMAITKQIVDLMTGTIEVQSEEGKGSVFTVTLPFRIDKKQGDKLEPVYSSILLIGDSEEQGRETEKTLAGLGVNALWTADVHTAVPLISENGGRRFQAVIIDRGVFSHGEMEKLLKVCHETTTLVLAAYDWNDIQAKASEMGISRFLQKPLFPSALRRFLSTDPGERQEVVTADASGQQFDGKSLLLAEDNELNMEIIQNILLARGANVVCTTNGADCVQAFLSSSENHFDLILMDIQMPVMNGYEASRRIRSSGRPDSGIPILAMSANAYAEDMETAEKAGMSGYLTKPIQMQVWLGEIARYLEKKERVAGSEQWPAAPL